MEQPDGRALNDWPVVGVTPSEEFSQEDTEGLLANLRNFGFEPQLKNGYVRKSAAELNPVVIFFVGWLLGRLLDSQWEKTKQAMQSTRERKVQNRHPQVLIAVPLSSGEVICVPPQPDEEHFERAMRELPAFLRTKMKDEKPLGWAWFDDKELAWGDVEQIMKWRTER